MNTPGLGSALSLLASDGEQLYICAMKKITTHLTEPQLRALQALSARLGLPVAELLRRAVDAYLRKTSGSE